MRVNETYVYEMKKGHARANVDGYVYQHILAAEQMLGRKLKPEEVVHHKDHDRRNNKTENLMVFHTGADHSAYHAGHTCEQLDDGSWYAPDREKPSMPNHVCVVCGKCFFSKDSAAKYCDQACCHKALRKVEWPTKEQLVHDVQTLSMVAVGKKYGVSDNSIRKWMKHYGI